MWCILKKQPLISCISIKTIKSWLIYIRLIRSTFIFGMVIRSRNIISFVHSPVRIFNEWYIYFVVCVLLKVLQYKWWRALGSIYCVWTCLAFLKTGNFNFNAYILCILELEIVSASALSSVLWTNSFCVVLISEDICAWPLRKCHLLACQIFAANGLRNVIIIVYFWLSTIETVMVSSLDALATIQCWYKCYHLWVHNFIQKYNQY